MKAIIYGAGQIGYNIAAYLSAEENDIVVIDESAELVNKVNENLDVQAVQGFGSYPDLLEKVGANKADLMIAVTPCDEYNIIACQVAYSIFKIPTKIAHIRGAHYLNPAWQHIYNPNNIPVDHIISPEKEVAKNLVTNLDVPGAIEVVNLETDLCTVVGLYCKESCPIINTPLKQVGELFPNLNFRVLCIVREGMPLIPGPDDQMFKGDEVYIAIEQEKLPRLTTLFGLNTSPLEKAIIVGAGNVGIALANELLTKMPDLDLKIIEHNEQKAQMAAQMIEDAVVIHGDALDANRLKEANVTTTDMVLSVMNNDESNVLCALLSKNLGAKYVTSLVNNATYPKFLLSLGVDSVLNPGAVTMSHILKHVRRTDIRSLHVMQGDFGEIFECDVEADSKLIGEKFRCLNVLTKSIVGGVVRSEEFIIPSSQDFIEENDHIILLVKRDFIPEIEKLFRK